MMKSFIFFVEIQWICFVWRWRENCGKNEWVFCSLIVVLFVLFIFLSNTIFMRFFCPFLDWNFKCFFQAVCRLRLSQGNYSNTVVIFCEDLWRTLCQYRIWYPICFWVAFIKKTSQFAEMTQCSPEKFSKLPLKIRSRTLFFEWKAYQRLIFYY